jgi:uncharacterized protein
MQIALIAALTVLAASVGTLSGFGISIIMVPALLMVFPLAETLLLVGIIHWFGNVWKLWLFKSGFRWRLWLAFGITGVLYSYLGATLSVDAPEDLMSRLVGAFLLLYVSLGSFLRVPASMGMAGLGGAASGFMAGIFGIGGEVRTAFLSAFDLDKAVFIATSGAIAIVIDTVRIATYVGGGTRLEPMMMWGLLAFIPASLLGAYVARFVVGYIPQERFRLVLFAFLALAGLKLLIWP